MRLVLVGLLFLTVLATQPAQGEGGRGRFQVVKNESNPPHVTRLTRMMTRNTLRVIFLVIFAVLLGVGCWVLGRVLQEVAKPLDLSGALGTAERALC